MQDPIRFKLLYSRLPVSWACSELWLVTSTVFACTHAQLPSASSFAQLHHACWTSAAAGEMRPRD